MLGVHRSLRRFCNIEGIRKICSGATTTNANSGLLAAATKSWDDILRADWVDVEETIPEVAAAENVIAQYRSVYDGTHDELYSKMRDLHEAKEAAKLVELYDAHFQKLIQAQETSTGLLGNQTKMREGGEKQALGALREYAEFVNVCESDRVARKIESELGRQVTFLRSQLSIEEFSVHVAPMAVDRIVVRP